MTTLETATVRSPVGALTLYAHDGALCGLAFSDHDERLRADLAARFGEDLKYVRARDPAFAVTRLRRYLAGELDALDDIAVELGGTPFQARVWAALREIPAGATWSYAKLARAIGSPEAVRAVGAANGRNPVSLVVPCHRVIASDGTLCGYGGGIERKRWLLTHERALLV
ncbi:MAG TPA: methylated-DNA--[protein]-cysteine S-methyltransferase [Polyangia bacterium]|jgi:methylated-DNA-[protein]-cysteine S-methyltransferase